VRTWGSYHRSVSPKNIAQYIEKFLSLFILIIMKNSDIEIECMKNCECCIPIPSSSLFKRKLGSSLPDVDQPAVPMFAVTVNIKPTKKMNNRFWKLYTHDQQRKQLSRIESHFRAVTPSVKLIRIEYEICPTMQNIHFHALYSCPVEFISTIQNYYKKYDGNDVNTVKPWRHLDVQECYDMSGWIKYISKTIV